ncbi:tripartite motif-containing protein 16-like [Centropristis striata]|uniref:tripartite motif-containing protein 16-like n=1 Tax=Centropristis striata TaxID=184440 RepID=UPI0027E10E66|nr:tripartite motif-containing protein 16-like [Centropristis striata]
MNRICCPICSKVLSRGATTPCGHNFCLQCLQDHWDRDERRQRPCSCPECGHKFPSRPQAIGTSADMLRDKEKGKQSMKRRWTETPAGSRVCVRHSSPLDIYCCTEEQIICAECASAEHTGHTIGSVREERRRKQEELKNIQTKSKQILQKEEKKLKKMEMTLKQIQEEAREAQDYCEMVLVGVIDCLQKRYMSVRRQIRRQEEEATAQVQTSLQSLQAKMKEMKKRDAELDHLAETDCDVHFLQEWPSVRRLCERDRLRPLCEVSEDPLLPFEPTKRAVDQIGRQLEQFCHKEFATILQAADDEEQQESGGETDEEDMEQCEASTSQSHGFCRVNNTQTEKVEPKTRTEFLRYACSLSLDPATAHVDLVISAGDKEVSRVQCKSPTIRYPQRFLHRHQVLCREGLQAECCYYEIEIEGDKAEIALAYKGIDRKARSKLSAFGATENSWSLDCSTHYSVSHRAESIQLTAEPSRRLSRLGVYLKFKEGTLSFYEVSESDTMKFLYMVEAEFTEPLYPGFWLGEKCLIRICDLSL